MFALIKVARNTRKDVVAFYRLEGRWRKELMAAMARALMGEKPEEIFYGINIETVDIYTIQLYKALKEFESAEESLKSRSCGKAGRRRKQ